MTQALAEVLADIDDPDTVKQILGELSTDDASGPSANDEPTLSKLYDRYLKRRQNRSPSTIAQYKRTIPPFVEFATHHDRTYAAELTTELVDQYTDELLSEYDADATVLTHTKNIRAWLRWLNKRGLCSEPVYRMLDKEELGLSPKARDEALPESEAIHLLKTLNQQRHGSALSALLELLWNAGPRIGEVHSLDVSDFDPENNDLHFRHRLNEGTRLKNGYAEDNTPGDGERDVTISPRVVEAIKLYLETDRPDVTDAYGRKPLFATSQGRAARSTLRRWVYEATSCRWLHNGPVELTCDGSCDPRSNVCPHSYYPHAIRRGAIVNHLSGGLRPDRAGGRFDVSTPIIKRHYDPRLKQQLKNDRKEAVKDAWSEI